MNRLGLAFTLAMSTLWAAQASASDHLTPSASSLEDYQALVRTVLRDAFDPSVRVRAIAEPSFQPEFVVGIREQANQFEIFFIQPSRQLWGYTTLQMLKTGEIRVQKADGSPGTQEAIARLQAKLPPDPKTLTLERCEVGVDPELAHRVIEDWTRMLDGIAPKDRSDGQIMDGVNTYFSMPGKPAEGEAVSPDQNSKPGMLVDMAYAMRNYCRTRDPARLANLQRLSSALLDALHTPPR